ncbi:MULTISPECIES: translation initiation factor IF-2 [unclassified Flavobacterium]|uniref:translation initiation factor IF-2 n=1 Tax=unclassified Flavobacterium TaxID=196869 RepID=UPI001F130BF7|nr:MULTISPECIES: translation initiation factor IF-2 [unclassified Flavobacterium]UMY66029.1 translation initiation factor IF-2 [Flavobacterium sp. HJ-32-4]
MSEERTIRISKALRELNISLDRARDFLKEKGIVIESNPNAKVSDSEYILLLNEFAGDRGNKEASIEISREKNKEKEALRLEREKELEEKKRQDDERQKQQEVIKAKAVVSGPKQVGTIDLNPKKPAASAPAPAPVETPPAAAPVAEPVAPVAEPVAPVAAPAPVAAAPEEAKPAAEGGDTIQTKYVQLSGTTFTGQKIDLSQFDRAKKKKEEPAGGDAGAKGKRKRIPSKPGGGFGPGQGAGGANARGGNNRPGQAKGNRPAVASKVEPTEEEVKNQIRETLEKLQGKGGKSKAAKYRRDKRESHRQKSEDEMRSIEEGSKTLKVTEFVTVGEVATMMDVPITKVIGACMSLGIMVTMNQRLDAETLTIVADEFGFDVEFITTDIEENILVEEDRPEDLVNRAPIVTVMGHVDHGKTSLLDYIRKENVIAGESGGITQHIGAYGVTLDNGQKIAFLDTPGHEAFTAMRARGAQVTDIAIIVIAADDDIMPQTKEAISHAQAAGVPIIFAINKVDKPTANPEKIKERLAGMNLLVEDWGGKIQSHDISAKTGLGVKDLLEKVLLEAEILDLKANPNRVASGTVVEAFLDKGKGYVATILVQNGTLRVGDYMLAGKNHGKIRAMHDERGHVVKEAGPATPVSVLGLDGAPTAGDKFTVFEDEREAKQIAAKRTQLQREQSVRTQRHITLAEIGRRIALGQFKELNIILKGDVDGSVEALSDSFSKLSTDEIQINIIHKGVGAITESDVMLASASDAIIIGFNVRPAGNAKQLADKEEIDIRHYSIIYDAIDDLKDAMEGMLSPEMKEEVTGTAEIREIFKISKVGSIAGCMVTDGKIFRNSKIRIIREGVVVYTGELATLKRFKDDVKEVSKGYDCGIQIKNYNNIEQYDIIEAFQEVAVKKKL